MFLLTKPQRVITIFFLLRQIFGFLVCFSFFESVRLFYKMIVTQRGEEETDNTAQTAQGPGIQSSAI